MVGGWDCGTEAPEDTMVMCLFDRVHTKEAYRHTLFAFLYVFKFSIISLHLFCLLASFVV